MILVENFHVELTNKCYLKCPRCARTTFIERFGNKRYVNFDLNFNHFKSFFDIDISNKNFIFCGNYGDPIYHPNIFNFVKFAKNNNCSVKIITNGSYKSKEWWQELISFLDDSDTITFSIDGIPTNFTQYRKNADWKSIEHGLTIVGESNINSEWSYIPFSFNIDTINDAKNISNKFGIKNFKISPSHRWEENDWLKPSESYLNSLTEKKIKWKSGVRNIEINPKCTTGKEHYISAEGFYMPCCYVGDWRFYYKSEFYKNKENYEISKVSLSEILNNTKIFYEKLTDNKHDYCQFSCAKL